MRTSRRSFVAGTAAVTAYLAAHPVHALTPGEPIEIATPMDPPEWALLEREVIHAHTAACEAFFERYFDARGYLKCVVRWGADDGPDDAVENVNDWPHPHALGCPDPPRAL